MKHTRLEECTYCPSSENLTDEHAPPKLLFAESRPSDLITVRACPQCNSDGSKDAEYFRLCLCVNPLAKNMPGVVALKTTVQRSLQRPQAAGFKTAFIQALEPEPGGFGFTVDMGRIHMVVRRIVQCLYVHETGQKLPTETHESRVLSMEMLAAMGDEKPQELRRDFFDPLMEQPINLYAGNQFAYWVIHSGKPFVSVWAMLFYGILPFIGFTGPKVRLEVDHASDPGRN